MEPWPRAGSTGSKPDLQPPLRREAFRGTFRLARVALELVFRIMGVNIGIMEKKMETTILCRDDIGVI